jgi:hypothetical protein
VRFKRQKIERQDEFGNRLRQPHAEEGKFSPFPCIQRNASFRRSSTYLMSAEDQIYIKSVWKSGDIRLNDGSTVLLADPQLTTHAFIQVCHEDFEAIGMRCAEIYRGSSSLQTLLFLQTAFRPVHLLLTIPLGDCKVSWDLSARRRRPTCPRTFSGDLPLLGLVCLPSCIWWVLIICKLPNRGCHS